MLQYKNYQASVNFSTDDGVFYGKILGIKDLVIFEGTTKDELNTAFEEAFEDYLDILNCLAS